MAVYSGKVGGAGLGRDVSDKPYLSVNVREVQDTTYDRVIASTPSAKAGGRIVGSTEGSAHMYSATVSTSINTPFYKGVRFVQNQLVVDGQSVDLGLIVQDTTTFFGVFNTANAIRTVESVGILSATSGVTVNNLSPLDTFNPYEEIQVELGLAGEGDATVNTSFFIKFAEDPTTYLITIIGVRYGSFYASDPNWVDGITVDRRFLTSVFASQNMTESRKVLRDDPLRSLSASVVFSGQQAAGQMWSLLRSTSASTTAHPWYPDKSVTTATNDIQRVYCPTAYRRFSAGDYAFFVGGTQPDEFNVSEVIRIDEVFGDGLSTQSDIINTFGPGASVYPAVIGYASLEGNPASLLTDSKGEVSISVSEVYGPSTLPRENDSYTPVIRNGHPTFEGELTYSEPPEQTIVMGGSLDDSGRGAIQTTKGVPHLRQTATAICSEKSSQWGLDGFFNYLRGRGKPFWVKSELDFLSVVGTSGSTIFTVDNANPLTDWGYLAYCWVIDSNGDFDILSVVAVSEVSEGIQITLESNSLADIVSVRQAHAVRLDEDVISTEYLTDGVSLTTFTVVELQQV